MAVRVGALVEDFLREDRQERQHGEPEERRRCREHDQRCETAVVLHVGEPALELLFHLPASGRRNVLHAQHHQRVDDDEERQRVEQETGVHRLRLVVAVAAEERQRHAEEQRSDDPRDVELDRVERDRVRQVLLVDERRNQRLIGGPAERLRAAGDERQREDVPDLDHLQVHQQRERARRRHLNDLRHDERAAAIVTVGEDAADQREQDDRQLLQKRIEPEEERRARQRQHQPVLRDDLHPCADARGACPEPLHPEIAVGERGKHARHRAHAERTGRGRCGDASVRRRRCGPGARLDGGIRRGRGGHNVRTILEHPPRADRAGWPRFQA